MEGNLSELFSLKNPTVSESVDSDIEDDSEIATSDNVEEVCCHIYYISLFPLLFLAFYMKVSLCIYQNLIIFFIINKYVI